MNSAISRLAGCPRAKAPSISLRITKRSMNGHMPTPLAIEVPAKEPIAVRVTRIAMHTVSGRVVDTRQQPLAGVTATFSVSRMSRAGSRGS